MKGKLNMKTTNRTTFFIFSIVVLFLGVWSCSSTHSYSSVNNSSTSVGSGEIATGHSACDECINSFNSYASELVLQDIQKAKEKIHNPEELKKLNFLYPSARIEWNQGLNLMVSKIQSNNSGQGSSSGFDDLYFDNNTFSAPGNYLTTQQLRNWKDDESLDDSRRFFLRLTETVYGAYPGPDSEVWKEKGDIKRRLESVARIYLFTCSCNSWRTKAKYLNPQKLPDDF
jgi:hypothetical protein